MAFLGNVAQGLGRTLSGTAGTALVAVPASIAVLSVATLVARGLSNLTTVDASKEIKKTPLGIFSTIETLELSKWAAGCALFAVAAYKGANCCAFGSKVLNNASWVMRNVLPIQLASPTCFGFCNKP
jgi:hypothetical protein